MNENDVKVKIYFVFDPHDFSQTENEYKTYYKGFLTIYLLAKHIYKIIKPIKITKLNFYFKTVVEVGDWQ